MTTLRDQVQDLSPPWLRADVGGTILRAFGTVLDALAERTRQGVRLRFPGEGCSPTSLGYIGNDRDIERGPSQTPAGYAAQLQRAFDTWANAGGARTVLSQFRLYFAPDDGPTMRAVAEGRGGYAVWHEIDPTTGFVTRYKVADNWNWRDAPDAVAAHGVKQTWLVVEAGDRWAIDLWDDTDDSAWGDGGVWGSDMSAADADSINAIVRKWKPEDEQAQPILVFDPGLFARANGKPPNPDGDGPAYAWRVEVDAAFYMPQSD